MTTTTTHGSAEVLQRRNRKGAVTGRVLRPAPLARFHATGDPLGIVADADYVGLDHGETFQRAADGTPYRVPSTVDAITLARMAEDWVRLTDPEGEPLPPLVGTVRGRSWELIVAPQAFTDGTTLDGSPVVLMADASIAYPVAAHHTDLLGGFVTAEEARGTMVGNAIAGDRKDGKPRPVRRFGISRLRIPYHRIRSTDPDAMETEREAADGSKRTAYVRRWETITTCDERGRPLTVRYAIDADGRAVSPCDAPPKRRTIVDASRPTVAADGRPIAERMRDVVGRGTPRKVHVGATTIARQGSRDDTRELERERAERSRVAVTTSPLFAPINEAWTQAEREGSAVVALSGGTLRLKMARDGRATVTFASGSERRRWTARNARAVVARMQ
jgi:hypothetical protein